MSYCSADSTRRSEMSRKRATTGVLGDSEEARAVNPADGTAAEDNSEGVHLAHKARTT